MESELRHELEQNDLGKLLRDGLPNWRPIAIRVGVGAAIALGVWGAFRWQAHAKSSSETLAWNEFFAEDFDAVLKKNPGTHAARYARLRLAENALQDAKAVILTKREEANTRFEECHKQLDAIVSDAGSAPELRRLAMYLKAMAFENSAAPEKAKQAYQKLVEQHRDSSEARSAESRLKQLEKSSAVDFYRQMLAYKPSDQPRIPPKTDLDDMLKGMGGGVNPNLPVPPPPALPPKKADPPGRDLPSDDASKGKEAPKPNDKESKSEPKKTEEKRPADKQPAPDAAAKPPVDKKPAEPKK
jgi:hypothetical protein